MKLGLFTLLLSIPGFYLAQDNKDTIAYPNTFSSGSAKVTKFDNKARKFNDWAVSFGGGTAIMQRGDMTSLNKDGKHFGWNAYVGLEKQISDKFGLILQYQTGKTTQTGRVPNQPTYGLGVSTTRYHEASLIGDLNLSNLFRRTDNKSPFRWSLHAYAGIGLQGYDFVRDDDRPLSQLPNGTWIDKNYDAFSQPLRLDSFFYQGGTGLKFNVSRRIDIDTRVMYIISGDDEFDGGGQTSLGPYNQIKPNFSDNMIVANVGLTVKLGKHKTHLAWYDANDESIRNMVAFDKRPTEYIICKKGDNDQDGVCDDWDRELDTPIGARVDGSGKALDMDMDGVIDINDKCVTVAGEAKNSGCPYIDEETLEIIEQINNFEGIEFELNKAVIRPKSYVKLDQAASIIKTLDPSKKLIVIGATDTRGTSESNITLSQKRASAVIKYLVDKGVNPGMLVPEGRGETDLKYPECEPATKCPEWKNEANRRVYFKAK